MEQFKKGDSITVVKHYSNDFVTKEFIGKKGKVIKNGSFTLEVKFENYTDLVRCHILELKQWS